MIYADYSSTSLHKPKVVVEAMQAVLTGEYGNPSRGSHEYAHRALRLLDESRETVAGFFGLENYLQLGFTPSATYALNLAIKGSIRAEDHVITSFWEHNSVLRPLYQTGCDLSILPMDERQRPDLSLLPKFLRKNTKALVLNLMSNVTGNVLDIEEVKSFAKKNGLLLILDASQFAGVFSLKVGSDFPRTLVAITGHKSLYGPPGVGALLAYGVESLQPQNAGGSGVHSFDKAHPSYFPDVCEVGTVNLPAIVGLAAAVQYLATKQGYSRQLETFRRTFYRGIQAIETITIYGTEGQGGATMALNLGNHSSQEIAYLLQERYGIAIRAGAHCAPLLHEAYGTVRQGMLRFSFGLDTSLKEIALCLEALQEITRDLGSRQPVR